MNILNNYALQLGQKIDKIHTTEKFYPLPFFDYIVIQPYSKGSKNYSNWIEVLSLIYPILEKNNIKIVQVGGKDEKQLPYCYPTQGQTNWGQLQFIIKNSKLVLSTDSISSHLSGHYNIPLVVLISNNYSTSVSPFFGDKSKQIILEPDRINLKPLFQLDEQNPKQIDQIKPEQIAKSVLKLLNFPFNYPFETLFIGNLYNNKQIESICDNLVDIKKIGIPHLIMRMDINFNEDILYRQLQLNPCVIVSDKVINEEIIKNLRHNIPQFIYKITKEHSINFVKLLKQYKIPFMLITELEESELKPIKLSYLDYGIINKINVFQPKEVTNEDINNNKIYIKGNKFLLGRGLIYQSLYHYLQNEPISNFNSELQLIKNNENLKYLWKESDYCYMLRKID